jgi:photosystem II stability/assembly factor-like uncharacterized protein
MLSERKSRHAGKKLIKILFLCVLIAQLISAQWFQQENPTYVNLNSVYFIDSLKGWIVGEDSTILYTSNGGIDWINQTSGFSGYANNYNDVFFSNDTSGWVVGGTDYSGIILHTTDGGNSWIKQIEELTRRLNTVFFINDSVGWVGGGLEYPSVKIILKTYNRGLVWDTLLIETYPYNSIFDIHFVNENIGWAVGGVYPGWGNIIMKTTDGGNNWTTQLENYYSEPIASCDFISEQVGWVTFAGLIFSPVGIMNTMDGGITWNMQYIADSLSMESINSIVFVNDQKGWTAGARYWNPSESRILHTYDGGLHWESQNVPTSVALNSIFFINEYKGLAVGDSGTILFTNNGGQIFTENETANQVINTFSLYQNYPNPFNPSTKISWQSSVGSWQTLKIYDVLGNEVSTLVDEYKPAGTYEVEFNSHSGGGRNLTSGVYIYQLRADNYIETKKMVLMK